jgi:hypothetical protein
MAEFQDTVPGDIPFAEVLVNTINFSFRVEKMPSGNYCVCADSFHIKEYPSEEQAHAFCNRLIEHQSRESLKGAWQKTGPADLLPMLEKEELKHV